VATDRLYYTDCYLREFSALAVETADDGRRVYLDRTAFYPTSGGQPHDTGMLAGQTVTDVVDEEDGRIAHVLSGPLLTSEASGQIDWQRRYDHMQQHTSQHLLSAVLLDLFGFRTLSFHMGEEVSTIELGTKELTDAQIDRAEQRANELVREGRPVNIGFESAETVEGLRKASQRSGTLRIIEIVGVDRSACGGTHVRSTAELGPIQMRKTEKIRGNVRVEFVCGIRSLRRAKADFRVALELARAGAVSIDQLPEHVAGLRARLAEADKERVRLTGELARREGQALWSQTAPSIDGLRRITLPVEVIDDAIRGKAQAFVAQGRAIVVALGTQPAGVLVACSADAGVNAGAVLKQVLAEAGGRGGGSATVAQGSLPNPSIAGKLFSALGFDPIP
jgi:alanyl-tRNA synthetase